MSKECNKCGLFSSDDARECESCGAKFNDDVLCEKPKISLINIISKSVVEIPEDGCMIGRDCDIASEIFNHKWVSASHCRISVKDNECYVEDVGAEGVGSTNGTSLDGIKLVPRIPTKFHDGSRLKVAHLIFDVKVDYPKTQSEADVCVDSVEEGLIWVIECPVSGKRYVVEDALSRMTECECCHDSIDKKRISKVKPKQVKLE